MSYRTGSRIPFSGIYTVRHKRHRLPHEVTLLKNNSFPRCAKCAQAVNFELITRISEPDAAVAFRVTLNEIPVLENAVAAEGDQEKTG